MSQNTQNSAPKVAFPILALLRLLEHERFTMDAQKTTSKVYSEPAATLSCAKHSELTDVKTYGEMREKTNLPCAITLHNLDTQA